MMDLKASDHTYDKVSNGWSTINGRPYYERWRTDNSSQLYGDWIQPQYPEFKDKAGRNATLLESMALVLLVLEVVNDPFGSAYLWLILSASSANKREAKLNYILPGESRNSPDNPGDLNLRIRDKEEFGKLATTQKMQSWTTSKSESFQDQNGKPTARTKDRPTKESHHSYESGPIFCSN